MDYLVMRYGALGDGAADDTQAIQRAIDDCHENGGGRVVVEAARVHLIRTVYLKSRVELHVERGGKILLSGNFQDFDETPYSGPQRFGILAMNARDVGLTGAGEINGNGAAYVAEELPHIYRVKRGRPFMIGFIGCEHVHIRDVRIADAPCWTLTVSECENVTIHNVSVMGDVKMPNNDGFDIDHSRFVRISDCHLVCGDDCIVLKSHTSFDGKGPCEHIAVTNCTMTSRSFAINLGCEVVSPIRNCVFDNCVITNSHRGIGVHLSNECDIENVIFSNMYIQTRYYHPDWWGAAEPIYVVSIPWTKRDTVGHLKNIRFQNIICHSENGVIVYGDDSAVIDRVSFDQVEVHLNKTSDIEGGRFDLRPCEGDHNGRESGVFPHDTAGFFIHNARNVALRNCEVLWGERTPSYFSYALEAERAEGLILEGFKGENARGDLPAIKR